jgi:hypothetical protein
LFLWKCLVILAVVKVPIQSSGEITHIG